MHLPAVSHDILAVAPVRSATPAPLLLRLSVPSEGCRPGSLPHLFCCCASSVATHLACTLLGPVSLLIWLSYCSCSVSISCTASAAWAKPTASMQCYPTVPPLPPPPTQSHHFAQGVICLVTMVGAALSTHSLHSNIICCLSQRSGPYNPEQTPVSGTLSTRAFL